MHLVLSWKGNMFEDFKSLNDLPKRFDFMKLKNPRVPVYALEDVKTLYILMTLYFCDGCYKSTAKLLEIDRKTVKKYFEQDERIYRRITVDQMMYFFFEKKEVDAVIKAQDEMVLNKNKWLYEPLD